jgi:hypothetical protein
MLKQMIHTVTTLLQKVSISLYIKFYFNLSWDIDLSDYIFLAILSDLSTLLLRFREVAGSNLGPETGYPEFLCGFP